MTQKHYVGIAALLHEQLLDGNNDVPTLRNVTRELALLMKRDNPRFKAGKFFDAAGFPELTNTAQGLG